MVTHRAGKGSVASGMARFIHPSEPIWNMWPHTHERMRLSGLVIQAKIKRRMVRCGKEVDAHQCTHLDFPDTTFFISCRNSRIDGPCPRPEDAFDSPEAMVAPMGPVVVPPNLSQLRGSRENASATVRERRFNRVSLEDVERLRAEGATVDDDNDPLPENAVPNTTAPTTTAGSVSAVGGSTPFVNGATVCWITPTICPRRAMACPNAKGRFTNHR